MRLRLAALATCLLGLTRPAQALQFVFESVPAPAADVIVSGRGPIVKGDTVRLDRLLAEVPPGRRVLALALDSPGGLVGEAEQLAALIRARRLVVVIPSDSQCISACFLLFAGSPRRIAASTALIGVHSASEAGEETGNSLAVTTLMARAAAELGVPPAIIGKMVQTTPGRIEWLTHTDLLSMNVTVYDGDMPEMVAAPNPPRARPDTPLPSPSPAPGYAGGRDDRRGWNAWLGGLRGAWRDGAVFAVNQLGEAHQLSCFGPHDARLGDFTLGCEAARQRLAPVESRMRDNADYRLGWNAAAPPLAAAGEAVEAEYRGAYFCGPRTARLTLRVLPSTGEPRRRALFSFGPQPTSPDVPAGEFLVEGSIDPAGGAMTLLPVQWVSQPAGYQWFGLNARSEDGGKTFSGRMIDSSACSVFTFERVHDATPPRGATDDALAP
jgi:hypothetical protein